MSVDLDERVRELAEQRRAEIEQLVRHRLDLIIGEVLDTQLAGRANGASNGAAATPSNEPAGENPVRRCTRCGETKPAGAFEQGRGTCRQCRHQQHRDREHRRAASPVGGGDGPRPHTDA